MNGIIFQATVHFAATVTGQHLFNLDAQLLFDCLVQGVNILILFFLLSFLLFDPARKFLEDRKNRIANDLQTAADNKAEALAMKSEYEEKIGNANVEAEEILRDARKRGLENQNQLIQEGKDEAARVRARAMKDIELEKKHARDDVKKEVITLASMMAAKVVSSNIDTSIQNDLVEETIKELDEDLWQK